MEFICLLQKLTKISSTVATALYALANDEDPPKHDIKADDALVSVTQLRAFWALHDRHYNKQYSSSQPLFKLSHGVKHCVGI